MTETKIEWVVKSKNKNGNIISGRNHSSLEDLAKALEYYRKCEPERKFTIIKRTTVTTEEIVK